jgi:hypothetical protein
MSEKITIVAVSLLIGLLIGVFAISMLPSKSFGGLVHNTKEIFVNGVTLESILSATSAVFSSTLTVQDELYVDSSNSTIQVGDTTLGVGTGCLILGDSGGATSSPVYITATGATLSATTTKPSICK